MPPWFPVSAVRLAVIGLLSPGFRYPTVVCPMPFLETIAPPLGFSWLRPYSATSFFERLRVLIVR